MPNIVPVNQRLEIIKAELKNAEAGIEKVLPAFMREQRDRFFQIALDCAMKPDLVKCEPLSIIAVVMKAAQCGLPLDGTHAAMVPFLEKGVAKAKFIPMAQGLIESAISNGGVKGVWSHVVYDGDEFEETAGSEPKILHKPKRGNRQIEKALGAYACCMLPSGIVVNEFMDRDQIEAVKRTSKALASGPWSKADQEGEMWRKTVIRRGSKSWPKSPGFQRILDLDEEFEKLEPREAEFEVVPQNGSKAKGLDDLVPAQNGNDESPPPVRWHREIEISLTSPARLWLDQPIAGKGPLNGKTYRAVAESQEPAIVAEIDRILAEGAAIQADKGGTPEPYQKLAEACRVIALKNAPADTQEQTQETFA